MRKFAPYKLQLRNEIVNRPIGDVLLAYLQDFVSESACKNLDAVEIKGMMRLVQQIKDIPKEVEREK